MWGCRGVYSRGLRVREKQVSLRVKVREVWLVMVANFQHPLVVGAREQGGIGDFGCRVGGASFCHHVKVDLGWHG